MDSILIVCCDRLAGRAAPKVRVTAGRATQGWLTTAPGDGAVISDCTVHKVTAGPMAACCFSRPATSALHRTLQ